MEAQPQEERMFTVLAVMASDDDDLYPFDKIVSSSAFSANEEAKKFIIRETSYEKFLDGSKVDIYDCVLLTFMKAASSDDLEMKQDYYDYYTSAPIVHYAIAKKEQEDDELKGVTDYLKKTCDKKLFSPDPITFEDISNIEDCVTKLIAGLEGTKSKFEELKSGTVTPAFSRFDKDGNGTIDAQELAQLSKDLGQELTEDQLADAMKDLDMNNDGVIDLEEFSRWYFTGMKSYAGTTRGLFQMKNSAYTVFDVLGKENIQKIINEDKTMTKHRVKIQFNDPPEAYYAEILYHLLGPFTEKMKSQTQAFRSELGGAIKEAPGTKSADMFLTVSLSMKPGQKAKYEDYCQKLTKIFEENKPQPSSYSPDLHLKLYPEDDKIVAKLLVIMPPALNQLKDAPIPQGLLEGLKDVDQYIKIKAIMGADAEEILSSDKPLLEHYLKGFSVQIDVVFLKKLKAAMKAGLENHPVGQQLKGQLDMAGPAFAVGSNLSLDLTFDDMEEVKAHPMASTVLVSLDQLLQGVLGKDRDTILGYKPDFSSVDAAALDKHVSENEYSKEKKKKLEVFEMVGTMLKDINPDCKVEMTGNIMDLMSIEYTIEGAGYGDIVHLVFSAITMKMQEEIVERIISDFNEAQAPATE